jgi:hypothetical protein
MFSVVSLLRCCEEASEAVEGATPPDAAALLLNIGSTYSDMRGGPNYPNYPKNTTRMRLVAHMKRHKALAATSARSPTAYACHAARIH